MEQHATTLVQSISNRPLIGPLQQRSRVAYMNSYIPYLYKKLRVNDLFKYVANKLAPIPEDEEYQLQRNRRNRIIDELYEK